MPRIPAALTAALMLSVSASPAFAWQSDAPLVPAADPNPSDYNNFPKQSDEQKRRDEEERKRREDEDRKRREEDDRRRRDEEQRKQDEEKKKEEEKKKQEEEDRKKANKPEPELNIPIRYFVYSAILGGLGALTGIFSAGPERDLRDPAKHTTPDATRWMYIRAYYGGFVSKGFYALSGAMAGYAGYKTNGAVQDYFKAKAGLAAVPTSSDDAAVAAVDAPDLLVPAADEGPPLLISPFGVQVRF